MPKKSEISFWTGGATWVGLLCTGLGIFLVLKLTGVIKSDPPPDAITTVLSVIAGFALFIAGGLFLTDNFDSVSSDKCYYCKKKIWNFRKRITVRWPELTKYSEKEVQVSEAMHARCHAEATQKFRIPDPQFSQIAV